MKLLFVSNGHGEDAIGGRLAREFLRLKPDLEVEAIPIVGTGKAYERAGVSIGGPRWEPPSGGFTFTSLGLFLNDWRDGLRQKTHEQHWAVRRSKPDVIVVVGDVYALWVVFSFAFKDGHKPKVFQVQPLVSRYYQDGMTGQDRLERAGRVTVDSFTAPERWLMRRVEHVYARDERSAQWLHELGIQHASFAGNLMMDLLEPERDLRLVLDGRPVLALLPGTRNDYLYSFPIMLQSLGHLAEFQAFAAFPGPLEPVRLPEGWNWAEPDSLEKNASAERTATGPNGARVPILRDAFAALLHASSAVLGTAGTANEQAVGLGKPVIAFPTLGPQFTGSFPKAQKRLLGVGLTLTTPDPSALAEAVRQALKPDHQAATRQAGLERMGTPGGAKKVALDVLERLKKPTTNG